MLLSVIDRIHTVTRIVGAEICRSEPICGRPAEFGCVGIWLDRATLSGSAYSHLSARSAASAYESTRGRVSGARGRARGEGAAASVCLGQAGQPRTTGKRPWRPAPHRHLRRRLRHAGSPDAARSRLGAHTRLVRAVVWQSRRSAACVECEQGDVVWVFVVGAFRWSNGKCADHYTGEHATPLEFAGS
jgi:hypothetical protein